MPRGDGTGSLEFLVKSDRLTLVWDEPVRGQNIARPASGYLVYYRRLGTSAWSLLGEVSAGDAPSFTVSHDKVGNGKWEFAVQSVAGTVHGRPCTRRATTRPIH